MSHKTISAYFSKIGSKRTAAKRASSRVNIRKAIEVRSAPVAKLEEAYQAVLAGNSSLTKAAAEIAKCKYYTLRDYKEGRDAGRIAAPAA